MFKLSARGLACAALVVASSTPADAQGQLHVVSKSGCPDVDFDEVQAAIDAASEGDVVLVRPTPAPGPGYGSFSIDGKGLTLL